MRYLLTLHAVTTAARAAYEGKHLGFQSGETTCLYKGITGAPCAVGAALPEDLLDVIAANPELNKASVIDLEDRGWITFASCAEADAIFAIQRAHDDRVGASPSDSPRRGVLPSFEELIGITQ